MCPELPLVVLSEFVDGTILGLTKYEPFKIFTVFFVHLAQARPDSPCPGGRFVILPLGEAQEIPNLGVMNWYCLLYIQPSDRLYLKSACSHFSSDANRASYRDSDGYADG